MSNLLANERLNASPSRGSLSIRALDPRGRILAVCLFAIATVSLKSFAPLIAALMCSLLAMSRADMPIAQTLKRMAMMDGFIIFMLFLLPFTMPGEVLFTIFSFPASKEGLLRACEIALKANAIVLMLLALVGSMEAVTLGHALSRLKVPENLIHLMLFTVRYIEVLNEEQKRMRIAMKARGFRPSNTVHTYRAYGYLVGMLLVRSLERSERILKAMKCRGFQGKLYLLDSMTFTKRDYVFAMLVVATTTMLLFWEAGYGPAL